jgi:FMN phosphatase YigB (HAD superfamily)
VPIRQIAERCGELERAYVLSPDSKGFLRSLKSEFGFLGTIEELAEVLNERGDSGLYDVFWRFREWKDKGERTRGLSILSNQLSYRVPHVWRKLDVWAGVEQFDRIWFSSEVGLQKPFVGFTREEASNMNTEGINIFPLVVSQMRYLGYAPNECVFIDDSERNIKSAEEVGLQGIVFKNVEQAIEELKGKYDVAI